MRWFIIQEKGDALLCWLAVYIKGLRNVVVGACVFVCVSVDWLY